MIFAIAVALVIFHIYNPYTEEPKAIFGIYSVPGKWYYLKYVIFSCIYYFRKYANKYKAAGPEGRAGQGVKAIANPEDMEKVQPFSDHPKAFDAVFFISATEGEDNKGIYVAVGSERRPMGICNGLLYIGLPDKGLLCSKKIPDTVLFGAEDDTFGAEGIRITMVEPMKKWNIAYKGQMWFQNEPNKTVEVELTGDWTATYKYFDYDTDLYPPAVIRSIARESWSREYFERLKEAHQSHYEQFGTMKCNFKIGDEKYHVTMPSFRDHSFGKTRDWSLMHRYAFNHIFVENGLNLSLGVVCQPATATSFELGMVGLPNGEVHPIEWVDFQLWQHGEGGNTPKDYAFRCKAGDTEYTIQVIVEYESVHYVSRDWEAQMKERFCKYIVNGVPGRGLSEFHYRHRGGRPVNVTDPEWFKNMNSK
ncbi:uncharacterized protein LOC123715088 [Pieris brassicae]|uniref:uncharacterized protein LOC123715088 n=1 Tax=Pieris brassicae TaxID=7116 RepID=UPI001E662746|nr:uncharacterized protein LOC123715088 [Pieris brassicae]